jgi:tRNA threonylcarbamoyladenosine modification (KEOPS) complex  Pcc1 subunit
MEAEIILECDDEKSAEAIAKAVSPDNLRKPSGLSIKTTREKKRVVTRIKCRRKLPTFIATIDDLLFCASTAEEALLTAKKLK